LWIVDPGGRCLHLFDMKHHQYRKVTHVGKDPWLSPVGICAGPTGSMFVCDSEQGEIYRLSDETGGYYETIRVPEILQRPVAVHYDPANRELYIVDTGAHDIKVVGLDGTVHRIIGKRGSAAGEFNFPLAIAVDGSNIWVVDTGNHRVQALTKSGEPLMTIGRAGDAPGDMALPKGIALDSDGNIYVVDDRFKNVQIFDRFGQLLLYIGQEGNGPGEFWLPAGITIDNNDRIWICDLYNRRVQVFDYKSPSNSDGRSERFDRLPSMKLQTKR
jgi:sugar lactone lactonase YvrE